MSHIGRFATQFEDELSNIDDLVAALQSGALRRRPILGWTQSNDDENLMVDVKDLKERFTGHVFDKIDLKVETKSLVGYARACGETHPALHRSRARRLSGRTELPDPHSRHARPAKRISRSTCIVVSTLENPSPSTPRSARAIRSKGEVRLRTSMRKRGDPAGCFSSCIE